MEGYFHVKANFFYYLSLQYIDLQLIVNLFESMAPLLALGI